MRRDDDPVLRIGYLSADFRDDAMGKLLRPVIEAHDRRRFAIRAYALAPPGNSDTLTARVKDAVDEFVNIAALDDQTAAEAIAADDLDLLVDPMGHSAYARPGILRFKPARAVVTHLGYHGAVGLSQVDYEITDRYANTAATARWQLEALLPIEEGRAIAERVTGQGLDPARLAFIPYRCGDDAYNRARYALVDVALDTMPYTGGDTTAAALDAGVPVVTRVGARHAERVGYSILMHLGLTQTIAHTDDGYVELAGRLAVDRVFRDSVRADVTRAMAEPAATDPARYARALEAAFVRAVGKDAGGAPR